MDEYLRYSRLTGKKYNVFDCIRIYNLEQAIAYMNNSVLPVDIKIGKDRDGERSILVFYFVKEETKDVYDLWLKHELK